MLMPRAKTTGDLTLASAELDFQEMGEIAQVK